MATDDAMDEDRPGMMAAGWQQISRYQELPEVDRLDAPVREIELFADVYPEAPEAVPGSLAISMLVLASLAARDHPLLAGYRSHLARPGTWLT
jgi:hypothetical protein